MKKLLIGLLILAMCFIVGSRSPLYVSSDDVSDTVDTFDNQLNNSSKTYSHFYNTNKSIISKNVDKTLTIEDYASSSEQIVTKENSHGYETNVISIDTNQSYIFNINPEESGLYEIRFDYYFLTSSILSTEASMTVNDEYQYYEAKQLLFEAEWTPTTKEFNRDHYGNEIVPSSTRVNKWYYKKSLQDGSLLHSTPMLVRLVGDANNKIALNIKNGSVLIGNIYLTSPTKIDSYETYINRYSNMNKYDKLIKLAPEFIDRKSDISVRIYSYRDVSCDRYDSVNRLLNSIYHDSWAKGNQSISWDIDIEEAGLYNLSFKYLQTGLIDLPVQRTIKINNEVPYEELQSYNFNYTKKWTNESLHNDNGLMYVYLQKGINTITMSVNLDFYSYMIEELDRIMDEMTEVSLRIKYLNNGQTDQYREWKITEYIPNLASEFNRWVDEIESLIEYGNTLSTNKKGSSSFASLKLAIKKLKKFADDPNKVPNQLNNFTDGASSASQLLGNTIATLRLNPMGLEMIYLSGEGVKLPKPRANFFVRVWESIKVFVLSFFNNEYQINKADKDEIEVWVNRSRQHIEIMQQLSDDAGFKVKFSIMPDESKLILANSSGNLPDLAMGISSWIPYDLAIRGITVNLRQFSGYEDIVSKMVKGTLIPYAYDEGMYGLPETQDFWVLYYRSDIFDSLGYTVPSTWDELVQLLPKLQSMGLNFYSPISQYTGLKPFVATLPILYQYGGSLYSEDGMKTTLDSEANIEALKFMTNLFTIYNVPEEVPNFYNSFRQGTLPIGIANAGTYVQLSIAAPEIQGNWNIALHLGTKNSNDEIVRYSTSGSTGLTMFESSDKKTQTWEFVKWWLSTDTQERYLETLYSIYGQEYLHFPSNIEAFKSVPISTEHKNVILEQLNWVVEASRIPAAYMVERSISDAYSKIVFNGVNPRIALDDATIAANREIERKMEEFGYMEKGQKIKDYKVPTIQNIDDWLTSINGE